MPNPPRLITTARATHPVTGARRTSVRAALVAFAACLAMLVVAVPAQADNTFFRGATKSVGLTKSLIVNVPNKTKVGDAMVLFLAVNQGQARLFRPGGNGWERVGVVRDTRLKATAWVKIANGQERVRVRSSKRAKMVVQLASYGNVDTSDPVLVRRLAKERGVSRTHTTPVVTRIPRTARVVSYWVDRSNTTTHWDAPNRVRVRSRARGARAGHLAALVADHLADGGLVGGLPAEANSTSGRAVMMSVVLRNESGEGRINPDTTVWGMNEGVGASVMSDSGSAGLDGAIGADVNTGREEGNTTFYGFPHISPTAPPARPQHIIEVDDDPRLDPGNGIYTITMRYRSRQNYGNVIQKGQAVAKGGMWKMQQPNGVLQCLFRGADGSKRTATSVTPVNDGQWHTISCNRAPAAVTMRVDGVMTNRRRGPTGTINNATELTIAGKKYCNQVNVTCDYFTGAIDFVRIQDGG